MDIYQQIKQSINEVNRIIICLSKNTKVDSAAAALALKLILQAEDKKTEIVSAGFLVSPNLKFLTGIDTIKPNLPSLKQLIITLDTKQTPLGEFSYQTTDQSLEIYIEPEQGVYNPEDVATKKLNYKYDLIITLGVTNFESLGAVFVEAPDFFYTIPVINIDFKPNNERFGQINLVDLSKAAISEMIYDLLQETDNAGLINQAVATQLLTGILSETNGLKSSKLTPELLAKVAVLINQEVDVAEINKNLFHTKSLNMIKLWGRVLARLKEDKELRLVWSLIPYEDFDKTGAGTEDLPQIIDELIASYAKAELILLLWPGDDGATRGLLKTSHQHNALDILNSFSPHGRADLAEFNLPVTNILEAEKIVLANIRQRLKTS